jgi:two-component system, NtrC family, response regulator HydG
MFNILVIEDNDTMREGMVQILKKLDAQVFSVSNGQSGFMLLKENPVNIVVTDYRLPKMNGIEILQKLKADYPHIETLIITAYGSIDLAVEAIQKGAADFITKPFSPDEFRIKIEKVIAIIKQQQNLQQLKEENAYLKEELEGQFNFGEIIGESPKMKDLYRIITKVAKTDSSVIIYGESGTGKELVARAIHKASTRSDKSFIRVNCGALAEGVLESELFGHEKGSFTGALRQKKGRFELANNGTIFLDEIGDLPSATQVKLLRVLQEQEFERVGGEETLTVNVRVIAATNRDLKQLVKENSFREDLYYRLHIIPVELAPLRERREDIKSLALNFLKRVKDRLGKQQLTISDDALFSLGKYNWPGNVRELENVLERAAVLADGETINLDDLPFLERSATGFDLDTDNLDLNDVLAAVEKKAIEKALEKSKGVKTETARLLGLKTSALYYKLEKYGFVGPK